MNSHPTGEPSSQPRSRRSAGRQPLLVRQWPILLVLSCLGLGLAVVAADHFRRGTVLLALSVLLAAVLRLTLPTRDAGLLAVRSRVGDVIVLGGLGAGLLVLAWIVPRPA